MLGRLLGGKYQVTRLLGEGGMGAVYEAQNVAIQRRVAIKTIHRHKMDDPSMMSRFRREAFAMAAVESEHVAAILDAGEDDQTGMAFLVMEFLAGEDLAQVLARVGPLPAETALRIVHQALQGLRAAHLAGLMHRDIKPSNIFLVRRPDGARLVKLVDFGIARSLSDAESVAAPKVTKTGIVVGSPPYMSPEQLGSSPALDDRTDLWSLGVVLFEMLAGANPYAGAPDLPQLLARICLVPPPLVRDVAPWVPGDVAAIVGRAMRQNPAERYPSAAVMLADVSGLLERSHHLTEAMLVTVSRVPVGQAQGATIPILPAAMGPAAPWPATEAMPPRHPEPAGRPDQPLPPAMMQPGGSSGPMPGRHRATVATIVAGGLAVAGIVAGGLAASHFLLRQADGGDTAGQTGAGSTAATIAVSASTSTPEIPEPAGKSPEPAASSTAPAGAGSQTAAATASTSSVPVPTGSSSARPKAQAPAGTASTKPPASKAKSGSAFGNSRGGD